MVYPRYTASDWNLSNKTAYNVSAKECSTAERLRSDAWRTVKDIDVRTRNRQKDATRKLFERVADISLMREELSDEINHMHMEIDNLKEYKRILERALEDSSKPLHIGQECLMHREKRYGIDMVHDDVEKSLIREVEIINRSADKMRQTISAANAQLKMNRAALHSLDIDMKDKEHAQSIDDRMHHLRNSSAGIGYYPGIEHASNTMSIPDSWTRFTQHNLLRSQKERANSERLRGEIDACLRQCANAMWCQFNTVNNSFNARIRETTDTRNKMQAHLQKILQEIFDTEKSIDLLRKAIHKKEGPMKVAQTRLEERNHRVNVELCNDPAMKTLQREVTEIRESVKVLHDKLRNAEAALARLVKTRSTLENDINVKENSLQVDSKLCMGMRKSFPMEPNIGPIFQMPLDI
ncbi:tektin-3-like [Octopus sinensis]|uniref:Tektin n=1 Tax=Octopus sinensis TaxID=2607531 RepID=A0A6P7SK59_9MOLL|nr:tektin-3-like [Octopus sinensis]